MIYDSLPPNITFTALSASWKPASMYSTTIWNAQDMQTMQGVQGTAEGAVLARDQLNSMLDLAETGIGKIIQQQKQALGL